MIVKNQWDQQWVVHESKVRDMTSVILLFIALTQSFIVYHMDLPLNRNETFHFNSEIFKVTISLFEDVPLLHIKKFCPEQGSYRHNWIESPA